MSPAALLKESKKPLSACTPILVAASARSSLTTSAMDWLIWVFSLPASPEAFLAREAEICYATMAHVTDYDVWHVSEAPVTVEMVIQTLNKNTAIAQEAVHVLAGTLKAERNCDCGHALATALITHKDAIPSGTREKLDLLVNKYL